MKKSMFGLVLILFVGTTGLALAHPISASPLNNLGTLKTVISIYYGDNKGEWPPSLNALVPQYLKFIPADGVTGSNKVVAIYDGTGGWVYDKRTGNIQSNAPKNGTSTTDNSGVSQINAGGSFTFLIRDTGVPLKIGSGNGDTTNNQLWLRNDSTGHERLLVACKDDTNMENEICDIQNPQISPDKTKVYFESSAWATSGAIHVVDLKTGKEKFLCSGNRLQTISFGNYKGDIVTLMHKYYTGGGSYDHYFVLDNNGKELLDLGESLDESKLK
jgi:hypothetical protein